MRLSVSRIFVSVLIFVLSAAWFQVKAGDADQSAVHLSDLEGQASDAPIEAVAVRETARSEQASAAPINTSALKALSMAIAKTFASPPSSVDSSEAAFREMTKGLVSERNRELVLDVMHSKYPQGLRPTGVPHQYSNGRVEVRRSPRDGGGYSDIWRQDGYRYYVAFSDEGVPESASVSELSNEESVSGMLFFDKNGLEHGIAWLEQRGDNTRLLVELISDPSGVKYRWYNGRRVVEYDQDFKPVNTYRSMGDGVHYQRLDKDGRVLDTWESTGATVFERVGG